MAKFIYAADAAMRSFLGIAGSVVWLGIWLTGFDVVHWILYVPASFFLIAAITGICPGHIITRKIFNKEPESSAE